MDTKALFNERVQLFKNAIAGKESSRFPYLANMWTWKFADQGLSYKDALTDYDLLAESFRKYLTEYPCDAIIETGWRNPVGPQNALGSFAYVFHPDNPFYLAIDDQCYFDDSDYDALIANPEKFLWNVFIPRRFPYLAKEDPREDLANFLKEYAAFGASCGRIAGLCINEFGAVPTYDANNPDPPCPGGYEILFNLMRGIRGMSKDIRRCPEKVLAASEALQKTVIDPIYSKIQPVKGTCMSTCFDQYCVMLGHVILSPKQFEKFYYPALKKEIDYVKEYDKCLFVFAEGENSRFYDFFKDLTPGHSALLFENDDPREMKKALPDATIFATITTNALISENPQDAVDEAKGYIEDIGYDGRMIFSHAKMLSFPQDAKAANLKAVSEFIMNYHR